VGPGRRLFDMTADQIETPFGVEVAQVNPPTLTLRFETSGSRTLPIAPAITGEVAPGYVVTEVTSEPAAVEVIGPQSALRQLSEVLTEPVSVEGATVAVRQVVAIGAAGTTVRLRRPQRATVVATVVPAEARRTLNGIPVVSRNVGPGLTAMTLPAVVSVTVGGPQTVLSSIVSGTVVAYVDLSGLGAGVHELPVRVERGPSFGVATVSPAVVQVIVE
jgi:YbbR domain-containing protein